MLLNLLISSIAVFITAYVLPGVTVDNFVTVIIVAIFLGIANAVIRPILVFLTLPITVVTLGLFVFVINAALVMLVDYIVPGFSVDSFWTALLFSVVLAIIAWFLKSLRSD